MGDGSTTRRTSPVQVAGLSSMGLIAAGGYFSLAGPGEPVEVATAYTYDRLYRLTGVDRVGEERSYAYDPAGNRTTRDSTSYAYDRADRITSAGGVSYTVDGAGNLLSRGADSFGYDGANRLRTASVGGTSSGYAYDGDGKRTGKTVGSATTGYTYDVNASLPVLLDDGGRKYVWGLGLAYAVDSSGVLVYHSDGLGSVRAITDGSGTVVQTYRHDEYGLPTESQGGVVQPFGYTGEVWDAETGLLYLRARMYEPRSGRFMSTDVLQGVLPVPSTLNRYSYVANSPITWTDPSGMKAMLARPVNCDELYDKICEAQRLLQQKGHEIVLDQHNLQWDHWGPGNRHPQHGSVEGHRQQFSNRQRTLQNLLGDWNSSGCGNSGGSGLPADAWSWATREAPYPQYRPKQNESRVVVGEAFVTAGAAYLAYRIARMVPSVLVPALWPTIPVNAVLP